MKSFLKEVSAFTIVRLAVLFWSASLLTLGYANFLQNMDTTFIASIFTSTLATFGVDAQKRKEESETRLNKSVNGNSSRSSSSDKST